jgi:cytochrome c-type biogenesis protein CcmH/NrfG
MISNIWELLTPKIRSAKDWPTQSQREVTHAEPAAERQAAHVLRWVAVAAVVIVAGGTLVAYLKYRAVYDSITG